MDIIENTTLCQWDYTQQDFLTSTAPYEAIYKLHKNPFEHGQAMAAMVAYAKTQGFTGFKAMYKNYCESLKLAENTILVDNTTQFSGQPLELDAGDWEADDLGVGRDSGWGHQVACPHPVLPVERLVNIDTGVEKLRLAYRKGKNWREIIVDKSTLASAQKVTALADRGISVTSETAKAFVQYISDLENLNYDRLPERKSIGRLGYIPGEGFSPYVEGLLFDGDASFRDLFGAVRAQGEWETWLKTARACRAMSITARVMLAASFASPLLEVLGALPFFVHLWGVDSGTGKTVALMLAASVWGDPAVGSYIKTFDATVVGHEKTAAFLNHLPLCLDELQLAKSGRGPAQFDVYKPGCGPDAREQIRRRGPDPHLAQLHPDHRGKPSDLPKRRSRGGEPRHRHRVQGGSGGYYRWYGRLFCPQEQLRHGGAAVCRAALCHPGRPGHCAGAVPDVLSGTFPERHDGKTGHGSGSDFSRRPVGYWLVFPGRSGADHR